MARTARTTKTTEERQAEIAALSDRQNAAILDLVQSDRWTAYLDARTRFHQYSLNNLILILIQCPEATHVAGYQTWKSLGRQVTKGSKSIAIWGKPFHPKIWVAKGTEQGARVYEEKDGQVKIDAKYLRFPIARVFDISQTEGAELPEIAPTLVDGDDTSRAEDTVARVTEWLNSIGWSVGTEVMLPGVRGYANHAEKRIALSAQNSTTQNAKTILHEAAHAILHGDDTYAPMSQYGTSNVHRGVAEIQAESTAYVVAGMLGLDTSSYSTGYVAGWASEAAGTSTDPEQLLAVIKQTASAVNIAATTIMDGLTAVEAERASDDTEGEVISITAAPMAVPSEVAA